MRPFNLYRSDTDVNLWKQVEKSAEEMDMSVSSYVIYVLRKHEWQRALDARADDREGK